MQVAKPKFRRHQLARPKFRGHQVAKPKFRRLLLFFRVYLHIEATGLGPEDEAVAIGIVDAAGNVLLDSLVRPQRKTTWPRAQRIHGISPAHVATAPTWPQLAPAIRAAVHDYPVVAYGADFHNRFVGRLLDAGERTECCGRAWMHYVRQWSPNAGPNAGVARPGSWRTLVDAAATVGFNWQRAGGGPHGPAIPAARACRAVWNYIYNPQQT